MQYLFSQYDCLIIESFGVGGIPDALLETFYKEMEQWQKKGKIVVIATQVANEGSDMSVYEVGRRAKRDFDLIETYDMTLEATVTKLMWLLSEPHTDYDSIRERVLPRGKSRHALFTAPQIPIALYAFHFEKGLFIRRGLFIQTLNISQDFTEADGQALQSAAIMKTLHRELCAAEIPTYEKEKQTG